MQDYKGMERKMQNNINDNSGWKEWSKYVLKELERLNTSYERLDNRLDTVAKEIAMLQVKAGIWGLAGGIIPLAIVIILWLVKMK